MWCSIAQKMGLCEGYKVSKKQDCFFEEQKRLMVDQYLKIWQSPIPLWKNRGKRRGDRCEQATTSVAS